MTVSALRINGTRRNGGIVLIRLNRLLRRNEMQKRLALHGIRNRKTQRAQNGRRNVDQSDPRVHTRRTMLARKFEEQRNVDGLVIEKNAMMRFAVLAERLAMICHDSNQAGIEKISCPQFSEELSDNRVGVSNFAVVRLNLIPRTIRLRWSVRIMRIVQMYP